MAPTAAEILADPRAQSRALILTGAIGGIQMADPIIASLALPKAGSDLNMDATQLALAASISTLFLAATVVLIGAFAERFGRRPTLLVVLLLAAAGGVITMLAPATPVFMLGRAIAGVGVGGGLACSYAYVRVVSPDKRLGRALGFWAAMSGVAAIPLCLLGAGLANLDWRAAFVVTPLACLIGVALTPRLLPHTEPSSERRQLLGVLLAGLGVVGLLYGISQAASHPAQPKVVLPIVTGIALLGVAAVVGLRSHNPSYPVRVFADPAMIVAVLSGALWNCILGVVVLQSSNLWQYVDHVAPLTVSILQLPANIAVAIASLVTGRLMSRAIDFRILMSAGFGVAALGFAVMALTHADALSVWFNLGLVGTGLGAGAAGCVQSQVLLDVSPHGYLNVVAASRTTFGQVGYAIGLSGSVVVTSLFTLAQLEAQLGGTTETARSALNDWLVNHPADSPVAAAYLEAFSQGMIVWAVVTLVVAFACVVLLSRARTHAKPEAEPLAAGPVGL